MNIEEAKKIVQDDFKNTYKDLLTKIESYKKTGSFSTHIGSYEYDYKEFSEFLGRGFCAEVLDDLFLTLFLLHFIETIDYNLDIRKYESIDDPKIKEALKQLSDLHQAGETLKEHAAILLTSLGVKDLKFLEDSEELLEYLKSLSHTKSYKLKHFGDNTFIVSKIPIQNKPFRMQPITLDNRIFYTETPEKIIEMAHAAKPGIYFVANLPYGKMEELAMYLLFRTEEDGYLVDFGKHSYREQIYRNSSKGEEGHARWLWRSVENIYLPVETVLKFFETKSEEKDIVIRDKKFPFRVIAKFKDEDDLTILWSQYFVDECLRQFRDDGVLDEVTPAVSLGFLLPQTSNKVDSNLPAEYKPFIPSVHSLDLSWDPKSIEASDEDKGSGAYLTPFIKELPLAKLDLTTTPIDSLSSLKQAQGHLVYQKRKQEADGLEKALWDDFGKNFPKVMKSVEDLIKVGVPDKEKFIVKAFEDKPYPLGNYGVRSGGFCQDESPLKEEYLLYWAKAKEGSGVKCTRVRQINGHVSYRDVRAITYSGDYKQCGWCSAAAKNMYYLKFIDAMQFMSFFGVSDKEIPKQMLDYLNQNRTLYHGNSILNDIDPLKMVTNPWWTARSYDEEHLSPDDSWKTYGLRADDPPAIFVQFYTCDRCKKKYLRMVGKTDHVVETGKDAY